MQRVELHALRIGDRNLCEVPDLRAQCVHARNDPELREQRKPKHQADEQMPHSEHVSGPLRQIAVEQRSNQKHDGGKDRDPMQLPQRASDNVPSEMSVRKNSERGRSKHEGKKDETANPDHKREQHQEAEDRHDGKIIAAEDGTSGAMLQ